MLTRAIPTMRRTTPPPPVGEAWKFTVNTEAYVARQRDTGIPFNLHGQDITLTVDWGDGTTSTLTKNDYTASDSTASVHTYATAGIYQVSVVSSDWDETYILAINATTNITTSNVTNATMPIMAFRDTVKSIDTKFPNLKGRKYYSSAKGTSLFTGDNTLNYVFCSCYYLVSVPEDLLVNLTELTSVKYLFYTCSNLYDFSIKITARDIASVTYFCSKKTGAERYVLVPTGSTTQTTFSSGASALGITVLPM